MSDNRRREHDEAKRAPEHDQAAYEAPRVEEVLTPEALEREILYGGATSSVGK